MVLNEPNEPRIEPKSQFAVDKETGDEPRVDRTGVRVKVMFQGPREDTGVDNSEYNFIYVGLHAYNYCNIFYKCAMINILSHK